MFGAPRRTPMPQLEAIWDQARQDLVVRTEHGEDDLSLWEHSARVARSAQAIAALPEVRDRSPNLAVLLAAALYHDAGWIVRVEAGELSRLEILARQPSSSHRDLGASLLERSLSSLLPEDQLKLAAVTARTLHDRHVDHVEGHVLADADHLEEFGVLALWPGIRRAALDGKGVQTAIDTWHRRQEYQFWTARLNDSFRFDTVREIARRRLAAFERTMGDVESQHAGRDLPDVAKPEQRRNPAAY